MRVAAISVAAVSLVLAVLAAQASASTQYFVTVSDLNGTYEQEPHYELQVSPALPEGASLSGRATCTEVYKPGSNETEPVTVFPQAGSYQFVTSSCSSEAGEPLTLHGVSGSIEILGGTYNIAPNYTYLPAVASESETSSHEKLVTLAAEVIDPVLDYSPVPEAPVEFVFQHLGGGQFLACGGTSSLQELDENGKSVASCSVHGRAAEEIEEGDGQWWAYFAGTRNFGSSSGSGQIPAAKSLAEGEAEQKAFEKDSEIEVREVQIPPNCEHHNENSVGLIQISLGELNCSELKVVTYLSQAVFFVTTVVGGGTTAAALVSDVGEELAKEAGTLAANIAQELSSKVSATEDVQQTIQNLTVDFDETPNEDLEVRE